MDREYIENEHVVDRYLSGELTVREARDFEKYCLEHPELLKTLPIPVRLKARLARRPLEHSETGMFRTIPSSATHAALAATEDGFDPEEERAILRRFSAGSRLVVTALLVVLLLALIAAVAGTFVYSRQAASLSRQLQDTKRDMQLQAPGSVQSYRVQPVRDKPAQATLAPGWSVPPQLLELHIDVSRGKYSQFRITLDRIDGTRILQIRRVTRDSNKELRLGLNSSALGRTELLARIEGYTWRGQTEDVGWLRLDLR